MASEPADLTPEVARRFADDMLAFFGETNPHKRDEIAARQLSALNEFRDRREEPIRVSDVKIMFAVLRESIEQRLPNKPH